MSLQVGDYVRSKDGRRLRVVKVTARVVSTVPWDKPNEEPDHYDPRTLTFVMRKTYP